MPFPYYNEPTHNQGTAAAASRSTTVQAAEGRLIVDNVDKIFLLESNNHPLVTLLTNIGRTWNGTTYAGSGMLKAPTTNPKFNWTEDFPGGRYCKVSGTYAASGAITITVTGAGSSSAYIFTPGDIILNFRTGERMKVATVASSTTITVAAAGRSYGATAAAAGADADGLYLIGNVNEEGASLRNVNSTQASDEYNYTQIFRTTMAATGTANETALYGGKDMAYQRQKKGTEHAEDIERAMWFSERNQTTGSNGQPERSTGGIMEFISSGNAYVQNQAGPLTASDLNVFLREGFSYGSKVKMLFCGGIVLNAISEIARGQIQTTSGDKSYGVAISEWVSPNGLIRIAHNPLFVNDFAGYAFLLDMDCFRYRYLTNRDTKLNMNVQTPGTDGLVDEYLTEAGLERKLAANCAMLKKVTD